ncbi:MULTISPECIES: DUF362 domain-containing protein [Haloferax]|uniref:Uncharacterized protein n=1 Tax=Haloferax massiliensis TaxID=1476858 RepID=A0A0D6JV24_9EURY|nr:MULTISPECIES: DUF362 domain-containing protein [Haloferax]MDS0241446.1 DUF362 domain-containing protein [Haloferax sp. S2CR25]MDS0444567.1 DUF362 domain-containing protein [Haloferax sp. S2CR25-2]CQR52085.1 hypothetical protein BN996_02971 [Haloferax massiliensis]
MVTLDLPSRERLEAVNDASVDDLPAFATVRSVSDPPEVDDVRASAVEALDDIPAFETLPSGSSVAITAGSRGIHDMPAVLAAVVEELQNRNLDPFIMPAMGSHGGATADGQVQTLASLGVTEASMGCEIRSSMAVERVAEDPNGEPIYAARDALEADAILLANRVKLHTDYRGPIESGLCKMAVVGLGKHRGAENMHNAAIARGFDEVIPERAEILLAETDIVGGIAVVENDHERAAFIEGVPAEGLPERESELLERSKELFPSLPVDQLDFLMVDELGKNISGTGMDTNVVGRVWFHNQPEVNSPEITRIYVRSVTAESHGNAIGIGLADYVNRSLVEAVNFEDMYVNITTSGEPERSKIPFVVPCDATAFVLAASMTGVPDLSEMRIGRITNTLEPGTMLASEPVLEDLAGRDDVEIGERRRLEFDADGTLVSAIEE